MEHSRSPDGVTSISVRPYYTMLSRVYLALAMGFLVTRRYTLSNGRTSNAGDVLYVKCNFLMLTVLQLTAALCWSSRILTGPTSSTVRGQSLKSALATQVATTGLATINSVS